MLFQSPSPYVFSCLIVSLALTACLNTALQAQTVSPHTPVIQEPWTQITGNPDLGDLGTPSQQPVDFAIWQAADKTWQVLECIRGTNEPGHTRLLFRFQGANLTDPNWTPMGIAMHADPTVGEPLGGLQAPYVWREGGMFRMVYGDWNQICMATSSDGKTFSRVLQPDNQTGMFGSDEATNTRDPMVLKLGKTYYCYYAANPNNQCSDYCRTSTDLKNWSDSIQVAFAGSAGQGRVSAECPFVVKLNSSEFYLFRTQNYGGTPQTSVYYSQNPLDFGINHDNGHFVCTLPVAAPEIVNYGGQYYIAALLPNVQGIRVARLDWVAGK